MFSLGLFLNSCGENVLTSSSITSFKLYKYVHICIHMCAHISYVFLHSNQTSSVLLISSPIMQTQKLIYVEVYFIFLQMKLML